MFHIIGGASQEVPQQLQMASFDFALLCRHHREGVAIEIVRQLLEKGISELAISQNAEEAQVTVLFLGKCS